MNRLLTLGLALFLVSGCAKPGGWLLDRLPPQPLPRQELKLANYAFVDAPGVSRFDLSGMQRTPNGGFLVVNDKASEVYKVSSEIKGVVQAEPIVDLKKFVGDTVKEFDLESIRRSSRGGYWIADEAIADVIFWNPEKSEGAMPFPSLGKELREAGLNPTFGMEGLCEVGNELWIVKEKDPILLLEVDPRTGRILKKRQVIFGEPGSDLTDCLYDQGILYLLNRDGRRVILAKPTQDHLEFLEEWNFRWTDKDPRLAYWTRDNKDGTYHAEWGTAEALELDENFVYIGIDNNGQSLRSDPKETRPMIMVFERPKPRTNP